MAEMSVLSRLTDLQKILCCPHTKSELSLITASELLKRLPEDERRRVPKDTTGAFVSEASHTAYAIIGRVIDFLEQDSLRLSEDGHRPAPAHEQNGSILQSVKSWYDEFGWQKNESGIYNDTAIFSQASLTAHGLYELSSHLSLLDRLSGGEFVLDAASGPIAQPEKLAYSWFHKYRVCVDISLTALREADAKLSPKGFCCMADICQLPFRDSVFDGVVSGYTIQHVAGSRQVTAIAELYRVLKPAAHLCIISGVQPSRAHWATLRALRLLRRIGRASIPSRAGAALERGDPKESSGCAAPSHDLYYYERDLAWWCRVAKGLTDSCQVRCLRLFDREEFESLFGKLNAVGQSSPGA
jgi:SAM-dependent methyltransferase